jgi:hypothetical protein
MANLCPAKRVNALPERGKFHHVSSVSIELLDKIGAKCDLAEAHYQLASKLKSSSENRGGEGKRQGCFILS